MTHSHNSLSFKSVQELFSLGFWPEAPTVANYSQVLTQTKFGNSRLVAGVTTLSVLFFDSLVGYTLAKF